MAIYDIHQFMIDKRPNHGHSLVNGYQSIYGGLWWGGVSRYQEPEITRGTLDADGVKALWAIATEWGCGRRIDILTLAAKLRDLLAVGPWNAEGALKKWMALPFFPGDSRVVVWTKKANAEFVKMKVDVYEINDIGTTLGLFDGILETKFLSPAIVEYEARRLGVYDRWSV